MSKFRNWVFTLNNYTADEETHIQNSIEYTYVCYGREVGEEAKTPHLQGMVCFKNARSLAGVKKIISARCHLEKMMGTVDEARAYCIKDGDIFEKGEKPMSQAEKGQSEKDRYETAWRQAKLGNYEAIDADIRVRCYSTLKNIAKDFLVKPADLNDVCGTWIWGPPGTGKSRLARHKYPIAYDKPCNKWWDGYAQQPACIIDDFDLLGKSLGHHLKIWSDRYSFIAEIKGGAIAIRPQHVCITSNYHPEAIWPEDQEMLGAILRRFEIIKLDFYDPSLYEVADSQPLVLVDDDNKEE